MQEYLGKKKKKRLISTILMQHIHHLKNIQQQDSGDTPLQACQIHINKMSGVIPLSL